MEHPRAGHHHPAGSSYRAYESPLAAELASSGAERWIALSAMRLEQHGSSCRTLVCDRLTEGGPERKKPPLSIVREGDHCGLSHAGEGGPFPRPPRDGEKRQG